ncbi:phage tail assembly protein [Celerinatantimonas diazotrophica]|uniref:Tail assembly chaperone E/41/14-like protein n=1 Tax=Celerinatantimonas diazotrophica TaxID=412034 RepID=A0A4R1JA68_9GAMM|nr:phage tail assembly protein [Celerinatantimonas diazotrophica]TCK47364.1 hypothetical protein EV690_2386 [Celerinatantimonas diazotrophica]CAG9295018.1 hypothetical protein CEDIAZO_00124 [Celerinatantimonas diazotrophica]
MLQTEYQFTLPRGYVDPHGNLHREVTMRLATAGDEIQPMRDPRVQQNPSYLSVILLSRVLVRLGTLDTINTQIIESLFSADFAFLQDVYNRINHKDGLSMKVQCPKCQHEFDTELSFEGE